MLKLKLQDITAESMSLARVERMNWNTFGTLCNVLEKIETENNPSDTPGNIFNIDKLGTQK
jgi:hypothetical protein